MVLIKLICKHCNGQMELDDSLEVATCRFCGTKHVIVRGAKSTDCKDVNEYVKEGIAFIEMGQFDKAYEHFKKAVDADPNNSDALGWYAIAMSRSSSPMLKSGASSAFEKSYRLSNNEEARGVIISAWLSHEVDFNRVYNAVDDTHKEVVIARMLEGVEKPFLGILLTYIGVFKFLLDVRGEEYVKETIIPKWIEQLKSLLSAGKIYPDPLLVEVAYHNLNDEEKRKAISLLATDACRWPRDTDHHKMRRAAVLRLSVQDEVAFKDAIRVESFLTFKESTQLARENAAFFRSKKEAEKKEKKAEKKGGFFSR